MDENTVTALTDQMNATRAQILGLQNLLETLAARIARQAPDPDTFVMTMAEPLDVMAKAFDDDEFASARHALLEMRDSFEHGVLTRLRC